MGKLNSIAIFTPLHIKKGWFIAFVFFFIPTAASFLFTLTEWPIGLDERYQWKMTTLISSDESSGDERLLFDLLAYLSSIRGRKRTVTEHVKRRPRVRRRKYFGSFNTLVHELANNKATEWIYSEDTVPCICFEIQRIISCCWNVFV